MRALALIAGAALVLSATPAASFDRWNGSGFSLDHQFHSRYDGMFRYYGGNSYYTSPPPSMGAPKTTAPEDTRGEAEYQKWVAFCQPKPEVDDMGITHLAYAHKNCDTGRSE